MKNVLILLLFSSSLQVSFAQTNLSFSGAGDLQMALGRYQIGTSIDIICRADGYYAEMGGIYHMAANWSAIPTILYRGESGQMNERLKFYSYVDPNTGSYMYLFATWVNWSPSKATSNTISFTITTKGTVDVNETGSFSSATEIPSLLALNSSYKNVGIGTMTPEAIFHVNGDSRYNGSGWFARNNNGANTVVLKLGQNMGWDNPVVEISTEDVGGTSTSYWFGSRYGHTVKFQRASSSGVKNMVAFGGTDGGHIMQIFSADGSTEKIRFTADGTSYLQGSVAIGTTDPLDYKLAVNGNAIFNKVKVKQFPWADHVFNDDYKLPSLKEVEAHIKQFGHLPGVPSEKEIQKNGLDLGDNQATLLKKIEELTLYVIELNKDQQSQKKCIEEQRALIMQQQRQLNELKNQLKN